MGDLRLTVGKDAKGRGLLAIITRGGHPQIVGSGQCEVVDVKIVPTMKAAKAWLKAMSIARPWDREKAND